MITLFTDGAARGNPGPAGAGMAIFDDNGSIVYEGHKYLGETTNNQAEYIALISGLEKAVELGYSEISIKLDSELIVKQIRGEYKVKNEGLKPRYQSVIGLLKKFSSYEINHVPRAQNKVADSLANEAIDNA